MRSVIPLVVICFASLAVAAVMLPADPWSQHQVLRAVAILLVAVPCYFAGLAQGREMAEQASDTPTRRRPWLQFSLRTLLLVMTLVAVYLGLHCERARRQQEAVEALARISLFSYFCHVNYDNDFDGEGRLLVYPPFTPPRSTPWIEQVLGRDFFHKVIDVELDVTDVAAVDKALPHLKRLPHLESIIVSCGCRDDEPTGADDEPTLPSRQEFMDTMKRLRLELPHVRSRGAYGQQSSVRRLKRELSIRPHLACGLLI